MPMIGANAQAMTGVVAMKMNRVKKPVKAAMDASTLVLMDVAELMLCDRQGPNIMQSNTTAR